MKQSVFGVNKSKLIASMNNSFKLSNQSGTITLDFVNDAKTASILSVLKNSEREIPFRLSLRLERIRGNYAFPVIDVLLEEESDALGSDTKTLGKLALYGLKNSSTPSPGVKGIGLFERLDVTEIFIRKSDSLNWLDRDSFTIKLVPTYDVDSSAELTIDFVELWYEEHFSEITS